MLINDLEYYHKMVNYSGKCLGIDSPDKSWIDSAYWHAYPVQDFDYQFNSWGFRGPEYNNLIGKPVNICLGDSFTVNLGGPIEHSWCSQLSSKMDLPTINLGVHGAGNDTIRLVYERANNIFDVKNTFVMYSFFHRRLKNNDFIQVVTENEDNFKYFTKQFIEDAYYAFLPSWCWTIDERTYINKNYNNVSTENREIIDADRKRYVNKDVYEVFKGASWPTYDEVISGAIMHPETTGMYFDAIFENNLNMSHQNRDGFHMNLRYNKLVADYFYEQFSNSNS